MDRANSEQSRRGTISAKVSTARSAPHPNANNRASPPQTATPTQITVSNTTSSNASSIFSINYCKLQHMLPDLHRLHIVRWMVEDYSTHGPINLMARTVRDFPCHFRSPYNVNRTRVSRYWKSKDEILLPHQDGSREGALAVTKEGRGFIPKVLRNPKDGRGRERAPWITELCPSLVN